MNEIIDDINYLMCLTEHELTEKLLENKYNKALLRELVRQSVKEANFYKMAYKEAHQCLIENKLDAKSKYGAYWE